MSHSGVRRSISVEILGAQFTIQADEDIEYLQSLVEHFQSKVAEAKTLTGVRDVVKLALISGLLVTDELMKERKLRPQRALSLPEVLSFDKEAQRLKALIEYAEKALHEHAQEVKKK